MNWSYGITAVPSRANNLLVSTLQSLAYSGFTYPTIFMDGAVDLTEIGGEPMYGEVVIRHPPTGHLGNWMTALFSLYATNPGADRYALFEDDLIACPNLREYLEWCEYPEHGYWNLLTHNVNLLRTGGVTGWHLSNQKGKGAVGLVFDRATVQALLATREFIDRPVVSLTYNNKACADGMVCDSLIPQGYREYIHYPSLLQHVGIVSTMPAHKYGTVTGWKAGFDPRSIMETDEGYRAKEATTTMHEPTQAATDNPQQPTEKEGKPMTEEQALAVMVAPGQKRPNVWRGGVIQILVTRACDLACFGCTQGSNLGGKPVVMMPDEFEKACQSLEGYFGVVGMFGGNPAVHPYFKELCAIMARYFPKQQRGLWCNNAKGHGKLMRETFNPAVSNLNVHGSQEAFDEFRRDWPEAHVVGLRGSRHSPPYVAMLDVIEDEAKRWELIAGCDINRNWSAMVCYVPNKGLRAFFCEVAGAQAMLHAYDESWPDTGLDPTVHYLPTGEDSTYMGDVVKWWQLGMEDYAEQVRQHCHRCGIPLKRYGQLDQAGEYEEVSKTHQGIYVPKKRGREVRLVSLDEGPRVATVTNYIPNANAAPLEAKN